MPKFQPTEDSMPPKLTSENLNNDISLIYTIINNTFSSFFNNKSFNELDSQTYFNFIGVEANIINPQKNKGSNTTDQAKPGEKRQCFIRREELFINGWS